MKPLLFVVGIVVTGCAADALAQSSQYRGRNFDYYQDRSSGYDDSYDSGYSCSSRNRDDSYSGDRPWYEERGRQQQESSERSDNFFKEQYKQIEENRRTSEDRYERRIDEEKLKKDLHDDLADSFNKPRDRGIYYEEPTSRDDRFRTIAPRGGQEFGDDRFDYRKQKSMSEIMQDQLRPRD